MSFTQSQIDALKAAIATGALTVRNANGELVTYRSLAEMRQALGIMEAEVAGPTRRRASYIHPVYRRFPCGRAG